MPDIENQLVNFQFWQAVIDHLIMFQKDVCTSAVKVEYQMVIESPIGEFLVTLKWNGETPYFEESQWPRQQTIDNKRDCFLTIDGLEYF